MSNHPKAHTKHRQVATIGEGVRQLGFEAEHRRKARLDCDVEWKAEKLERIRQGT